MDNRKAVLELKDVPPPPPPQHSPRSQLSQSFSLASLSLPPPCLLPPPQLAKESHQKQPLPKQQQGGLSPKVSICTHCDYCSTDGYGLFGGRGVVGSSIAGTSTFPTASSFQGAPINSSNNSRFESCSVASSIHQYNHNLSCGTSTKETKSLLSHGFKPELPSSVATSQPLSLHPYFPCCSGLRHNCSAVPLACSQSGTSPSSAPLASSVSSLSTPLLGPCLASGFNTCGVNPLLRASQGGVPGDLPTTTTVTTSTTSAHCCSNPLHLNVKRTVCGTRARFCQECLMMKVGSGSLYSLNS